MARLVSVKIKVAFGLDSGLMQQIKFFATGDSGHFAASILTDVHDQKQLPCWNDTSPAIELTGKRDGYSSAAQRKNKRVLWMLGVVQHGRSCVQN